MRPALSRGRSRLVVGYVLAGVVLVLAMAAVYLWYSITYGIDDAYALWGASDMVINHMETHGGAWPRCWDDLRPQFEAGKGRVGGWTFEEYQSRIGIDFNADPDDLRRQSAESPEAAFRVIWARWDSGVRIGDGPNQMLCGYFRRKSGLANQASSSDGQSLPPPPTRQKEANP